MRPWCLCTRARCAEVQPAVSHLRLAPKSRQQTKRSGRNRIAGMIRHRLPGKCAAWAAMRRSACRRARHYARRSVRRSTGSGQRWDLSKFAARRSVVVTIKVIVELKAHPGQRDQLRAVFEQMLEVHGSSLPGFLGSRRYEKLDHPDVLVEIAEWESTEARDAHFATDPSISCSGAQRDPETARSVVGVPAFDDDFAEPCVRDSIDDCQVDSIIGARATRCPSLDLFEREICVGARQSHSLVVLEVREHRGSIIGSDRSQEDSLAGDRRLVGEARHGFSTPVHVGVDDAR